MIQPQLSREKKKTCQMLLMCYNFFRHKWVRTELGEVHDLLESQTKSHETNMDRKVQMEVGI
jgi:hypothetical protein